MDIVSFRRYAHEMVDWMADYFETVSEYPVKSQVEPATIYNQLPKDAPEIGESFEKIFEDFQSILLPGITHWQSPHFHAYFPANNSFPSVLAEMLTATLGVQGMIWETSPAAAELEQKVMEWLRSACSLPNHWEGVIQDTASTATLAAIICAREFKSNFGINENGFESHQLRIYCSEDTHSSIEKAVKIAGFGRQNLVKIPAHPTHGIDIELLDKAIKNDIKNQKVPCCIVGTIGTTATLAIDNVLKMSKIASKNGIWLHIDAAYAGTAALLPEYRYLFEGLQNVNSYCFNPHKWMFTNFDCTAFYVSDREILLKTFEILPEYLKTATRGKVNDYRDWGIPLGRRFRALKLWMVIRNMGIRGIQEKLRFHITWTKQMAEMIDQSKDFKLLIPPQLNMLVFNCANDDHEKTEQILKSINQSGKAYFTHTKINGTYGIRWVMGQTYLQWHHLESTWQRLLKLAQEK